MSVGRAVSAVVGLILLIGAFVWGVGGLHAFGQYNFRYGAIVAKDSVPDRSATNSVVVTAFDYRAFDTLGEEFILFVSVAGVSVLLRRMRQEIDGDPDELDLSRERSGSESTRWLGAALAAPITLLAAYVITHGALTPGGGFQGGVILMSAVVFVFLGGDYAVLKRVRGGSSWVEVVEALGAAAFALLGFGGLVATGVFFENFINKGQGDLLTGGFIPLANVAVGLEVAAALIVVISEMLYQRLLTVRR